MDAQPACELCRPLPPGADRGRYVWEDERWRLWTLITGAVPGYSFLTSKRHIPYLADMGEPEASSLGPVLARVSAALRDATGAELAHIRVLGDGVAHLHVHLVPHALGDSLILDVVREDAADAPVERPSAVAKRLAGLLA